MKQVAKLQPSTSKPRIALALGAGAARGWAHIGVLRALEEAGIRPDIIVGTSIGAVVGGCYVADHLDELEDFARGLSLSRILGCLDLTFTGSGLMSGRKIKYELKRYLEDRRIEDLDRRFVAVTTELGCSGEVCLSHGRLVEAMHASFAIPGVFKPVEIDGRWFMDGACVNPVPVSVCRDAGADVVIAVTLNGQGECGRPDGDKAVKAAMKGPASAATPGVFNVMMEAFNATLDSLTRTRLAQDKPDVILSPDLSAIGMFDFHRADEAIAAGYEAAKRGLETLSAACDTLNVPCKAMPDLAA